MKLSLKLAAFIFVFNILIDLILSIIFSIWADREILTDFLKNRTSTGESQQTEFWPQFLHNYYFLASQIDFIFCSLLRLSVLSGAFLGIASNRVDGPKKLATAAKGMFLGGRKSKIFDENLTKLKENYKIAFLVKIDKR